MYKEDVVLIYNGIALSHKNKQTNKTKQQDNAICSNMDGPKDFHNKWSMSDSKKKYNIAYMWNLKKKEQINHFQSRN